MAQKEKFSDIHPNYKCAKFQQGPTIFRLSRLPESFRTYGQTDTQAHSDTNLSPVEYSTEHIQDIQNI